MEQKINETNIVYKIKHTS